MEAKEAAEIIREAAKAPAARLGAPERLEKTTALLIAVLAALLAFATISAGASTRKQLNNNIHLADLRSDTDAAKNQAFDSRMAADLLQSLLDATSPAPAARSSIQQRLAAYSATNAQLESNAPGGLQAAEDQIASLERLESRTESQILSFEYSEVLLQIGIVLGSVAILATSRGVYFASCALGVLGLFLLVNGFAVWVGLPAIH